MTAGTSWKSWIVPSFMSFVGFRFSTGWVANLFALSGWAGKVGEIGGGGRSTEDGSITDFWTKSGRVKMGEISSGDSARPAHPTRVKRARPKCVTRKANLNRVCRIMGTSPPSGHFPPVKVGNCVYVFFAGKQRELVESRQGRLSSLDRESRLAPGGQRQ